MNCNWVLSSLKSICIIVILYNIVKDGILKFAQRDNCCIIIIKYILFYYRAKYQIPTTWTIDHPWSWPVGHGSNVLKILNEAFREGLINHSTFAIWLRKYPIFRFWKKRIMENALMKAIYNYNGDKVYKGGHHDGFFTFMHAFLSHANDKDYELVRGSEASP